MCVGCVDFGWLSEYLFKRVVGIFDLGGVGGFIVIVFLVVLGKMCGDGGLGCCCFVGWGGYYFF